jgi:hypothetical protein
MVNSANQEEEFDVGDQQFNTVMLSRACPELVEGSDHNLFAGQQSNGCPSTRAPGKAIGN